MTSFGPPKIARIGDRSPASPNRSGGSNMKPVVGKTQKTLPSTSKRPTTLNTPLKQRSSSQPTSATVQGPKLPRPRSDGDHKKRLLTKKPADTNQQAAENDSIKEGEDEDEDVEYKSATILKDCEKVKSDEKCNVELLPDESDRNSERESDAKSVINDGESVRASVSGIPLRIRQKQSGSTPIPANAKPSKNKSPDKSPSTSPSRIAKSISHASTVASSQNRGSISRSSLNPKPKTPTTTERRTLEAQFQTRKKRFDVMKNELSAKQKLVKDSYHVLVQLKKKLEESGSTNIILEDLVLGDSKPDKSSEPNQTGNDKPELDPAIVENMKKTVRNIPMSLIEICRHLMTKRLVLLETLEKVSEESMEKDDLQENIKIYREDSFGLEKMLEENFLDQDRQINELVEKWQFLVQNSGDNCSSINHIEQLENKVKQLEQKLTTIKNDLHKTVQLKEQYERKNSHAEAQANDLKEKMKHLEQDLSNEKTAVQSQKDKYSNYEHKMKTLKKNAQEFETKCKDAEAKYNELQKTHKQSAELHKTSEQRWTKEKEELLAKTKHDKQLLDKLNKERSSFEARVKTLEKAAEDSDKKHKTAVNKHREELTNEKKSVGNDKTKIDEVRKECKSLKEQLAQLEAKNAQLELKNKQVAETVKFKQTYEPSETDCITTDREAELYTELLATRVALKAAEDQIQNYNREKLRFIDSIQMLQGDSEKNQDSVAKTLIKNVETITQLETKLVESEDSVCSLKIEMANYIAEVENLKQRMVIPPMQDDGTCIVKENDLKLMLHEGKLKLEQSLKKSLEYEHKIIRYEHDLNRQSKQICEMENLLKVRDGLISMMKAKKDELQMENDSLNKYANEIRDLLIQAKEEARNRTELVQELTVNLDTRGRICQQLEKKVKELEGSLSNTNEKRFKLQDTIGAMEKELQSTKAHIISMNPDLQRYDDDPTVETKSCKNTVPKRHADFIYCDIPVKPPSDQKILNRKEITFLDKRSSMDKLSTTSAIKLQHTEICTEFNSIPLTEKLSSSSNSKNKAHLMGSDELEPCMNSYQNMQCIQKRLKFLRYAFKSLSKTLFHRDIRLKRVPSTTLATYTDEFCERLPINLQHSSAHDSADKSQISKNKLFQKYASCDELCNSHTDHSGSSVTLLQHSSLDKNLNSSERSQASLTSVSSILSCNDNRSCAIPSVSNILTPTYSDNLLKHKNITKPKNQPSQPLLPLKKRVSNLGKESRLAPLSASPSFIRPLGPMDNTTVKKPIQQIQSNNTTSTSSSHKSSVVQASEIRIPGGTKKSARRLHQRSKPISTKSKNVIPAKITKSEPPPLNQQNNEAPKATANSQVTKSIVQSTRPSFSATSVEECSRFINHVNNISHYMEQKCNHGDTSGIKKQYVLKLLSGSNRRRSKNTRLQRGYKSYADLEVTNVMKTHNLIVHSLNKINEDLTSSINLLSKNFRKDTQNYP